MKKRFTLILFLILAAGSILLVARRGFAVLAAEVSQGDAAANAAQEAAAEALRSIVSERDIMALVYLCDSYMLRGAPGADSEVTGIVSCGQTVNILEVQLPDSAKSPVWVKISCFDGETERQGYIERERLACSDERFLAWEKEFVPAGAGTVVRPVTGADYSDVKQFPESYRAALTALKDAHPKWTFVPMKTGLDWQTVIDNEIGNKSLVHKSFEDSFKNGKYDKDGNWYYATEDILKYYMDPRNGLTESAVFQFELLTYNETYHTEAAVESFLNNTFMMSAQNAPGTDMTFSHIFWAIGREQQVSPFHLASRVYQEQGKGTSALISGTYPGKNDKGELLYGYYNYFNVKASGKSNEEVIVNGLTYAKEQGWSNAYFSILGGAELVSKNYIKKGQDTLYLQKYNVNPKSENKLYTHQYMQNISAPTTEGASIRKLYAETDSLDNTFVFKVPVYENMPASAAQKHPTVPVNPPEPPKPAEPTAFDIALRIPEGCGPEVWIDGEEYVSRTEDGKSIVTAADQNARSAVAYRYDAAGIPVGMYVWSLRYEGGSYRATEEPQFENILSCQGFSMRVDGRMGIRFQAGLSRKMKSRLTGAGVNGYHLKEYGTLVMNSANLAAYPMIKGGQKVAEGMSYGVNVSGKLEDRMFEAAGDTLRFSSVLVGLPADQYRVEYAFRGYLVLEKNGGETILYTPVVTTSVYALAEQIVASGYYPSGSDADVFLRKLMSDAQ